MVKETPITPCHHGLVEFHVNKYFRIGRCRYITCTSQAVWVKILVGMTASRHRMEYRP
jgi:hypothetical protein